MIRPYDRPLKEKAGFAVLKGSLFDSAIMKTSVVSDRLRERYLGRAGDEDAFEGGAIVFDGPEDYHRRINDPSLRIDEDCLLVMRFVGPVGYPGSDEVINMLPPDALVRRGLGELPCNGGRQSGTSGSPSILNASPEVAVGGGLALFRTGDRIRIDLKRRRADILSPMTNLRSAGGPTSCPSWSIKRPGRKYTGSMLASSLPAPFSRRR